MSGSQASREAGSAGSLVAATSARASTTVAARVAQYSGSMACGAACSAGIAVGECGDAVQAGQRGWRPVRRQPGVRAQRTKGQPSPARSSPPCSSHSEGQGPLKNLHRPRGPRPRIHPTQPQGTCLLPPFAKPCAAPDHPDAPTLQGWEAEDTRAAPALNPVCPAAWMRRPAAESRTRSARPPSSAAPARKASKRTLQGVERGAGCLCQSHSGAARQ